MRFVTLAVTEVNKKKRVNFTTKIKKNRKKSVFSVSKRKQP